MANYKAPPLLSKCELNEDWLLEINIWQGFTKEDETKQGRAIFLSLEVKTHQPSPVLIKSKDGVKEIMKVLDKLYICDKVQLGFEIYNTFERLHCPADMTICGDINEFEPLLNKTTKFVTIMPEDILAYRLLKSADLSEEQEQLVKATIDKYMFKTMQEQLKRIYGDKKMSNETNFKSDIKVENNTFYQKDSHGDDTDDRNETYYQRELNQYGYKKYQNPPSSSHQRRVYYQRWTCDRSSRNTTQSN